MNETKLIFLLFPHKTHALQRRIASLDQIYKGTSATGFYEPGGELR